MVFHNPTRKRGMRVFDPPDSCSLAPLRYRIYIILLPTRSTAFDPYPEGIFLGFDPERITEGSRGLSEATPPVSFAFEYSILKGSQIGSSVIPSGSKIVASEKSGGIATLNPRLPSLTPIGVKYVYDVEQRFRMLSSSSQFPNGCSADDQDA
jgi:hypothetical protein